MRAPLKLFLANRLPLLAVCYLGLSLHKQVSHPWRAFPNDLFLDGWFRWDSGWYLRIARDGYAPIPGDQQPTNFFPLYPLSVRGLSWLTGDPFIAAFLLSNLALLLACVWLYRFLVESYGEETARRSLLLLLCAPFAYAYSAMYTESFFLVSAAGAFLFAKRKQWLFASLCAAAGGATRLVGVGLLLPVGLYYLESCGWNWRKVRWDALWLPLGAAGVGAHMVYLSIRFNDPLAFLRAQWVGGGWGADMTWASLVEQLGKATHWNLLAAGAFELNALLNLAVALALLGALLLGWRRVGLIPTVWALATFFVSLRIWKASGRYACVVFPSFVAVAQLTEERPQLFEAILYCSTLLLALLTFLFSHGDWVC